MVLDFLAVDNFDFTRKFVKKILGEKLIKIRFLDKKLTFRIVCIQNMNMLASIIIIHALFKIRPTFLEIKILQYSSSFICISSTKRLKFPFVQVHLLIRTRLSCANSTKTDLECVQHVVRPLFWTTWTFFAFFF